MSYVDERDACPGCGRYYVLSVTATPYPNYLAEHGTDADLDAFDAEHGNIVICTACGWRSDEEG